MNHRLQTIAGMVVLLGLVHVAWAQPTKVTIKGDSTEINGRKIFGISIAVIPPPDGKTPDGKSAWQEFADAGVNLVRVVPTLRGERYGWTEKGYEVAHQYMDAIAGAKLNVWLGVGEELGHFDARETVKQAKLRKLIMTFKDHPALAMWKGEDEPFWGEMNAKAPGKKTPDKLVLPYKMFHELDPHHPVAVIQAPRGTASELAEYRDMLDITGVDVFPISYPPGGHLAQWPNKQISSVGDWVRILHQAAGGKPVWAALQVTFSGTTRPGKILRMPTFPELRFMTYDAIINGANAVNYFGGGNNACLNERDVRLGYNWTFWDRTLKPLIAEINDKSPLAPALIAPSSSLPIKIKGEGIEFIAREAGDDLFIIAASKEPTRTQQVEFTGLPDTARDGVVLFEEPRKVTAKGGAMADWLAPWEVHVYRFRK